ncbi:MAG TPA: general stress protein [Microlunatus sp.]|nr:general stress protein [Microlunatus sp.]
MSFQRPQAGSMFELEFPQSVGIFNSYADAQKAVDYLADEKFAVQNLAIVGTDLKSVERVLGRRSWRTVLSSGVSSGVSTGLIVGIIMLIFTRPASVLVLILSCLALGVAIGLAFAAAGYAMTRGKRDFTSVTQTVATKYEVLCEHKVAAQAREMLLQLPGARAAAFE